MQVIMEVSRQARVLSLECDCRQLEHASFVYDSVRDLQNTMTGPGVELQLLFIVIRHLRLVFSFAPINLRNGRPYVKLCIANH